MLSRYRDESSEDRASRERFEAIIAEMIDAVTPENPDALVDFILDILDGKYADVDSCEAA